MNKWGHGFNHFVPFGHIKKLFSGNYILRVQFHECRFELKLESWAFSLVKSACCISSTHLFFFFFLQGKAHRDKQLVYLKDHLDKYYHSRDRKWIVLFPEGGFLRKRRETSQLFAKKHSLPHLTHVTLPRLGATHIILKTLSAPQENGSVGGDAGTLNQTGNTHTHTNIFSSIFKIILGSRAFFNWQRRATFHLQNSRKSDWWTIWLPSTLPYFAYVLFRLYKNLMLFWKSIFCIHRCLKDIFLSIPFYCLYC